MPNSKTKRNAYCSFCRKSYRDVGPLVEGPGDVYICGECIDLCQEILDQEAKKRATRTDSTVEEQPTNYIAGVLCFISYARTDASLAASVRSRVEAARFRTWIDKKDIVPGTRWSKEIENAVDKCTHLLLVNTKESVLSDNVQDEVEFALDKKKAIIPLIFDSADVPFRLRRLQAIDFGKEPEAGYQRLIEVLTAFANPGPSDENHPDDA